MIVRIAKIAFLPARKRIFPRSVELALAVLATLLVAFAKAAAFVADLDGLLDQVKNHSGPYTDLAERYFPFRDCEAEALLDIARQSRFIRSIQHNPRTNEYHVLFENDFVGAWFSYRVAERKSFSAGAGFTRKP